MMVEYYIYLTRDGQVEASITEREGILIGELECDDITELTTLLTWCQATADTTVISIFAKLKPTQGIN